MDAAANQHVSHLERGAASGRAAPSFVGRQATRRQLTVVISAALSVLTLASRVSPLAGLGMLATSMVLLGMAAGLWGCDSREAGERTSARERRTAP